MTAATVKTPATQNTQTDSLMVSSASLQAAIEQVGEDHDGRALPLRNGVRVTIPQLVTAARLISAAEPSVITKMNGRRVNQDPQERPGFIDASRQRSHDTLTLHVGIIPSTEHVIDRAGELVG